MSSRKWLRVYREETGQVFSIRLRQPAIARSIFFVAEQPNASTAPVN
jgi:hypothetical protein